MKKMNIKYVLEIPEYMMRDSDVINALSVVAKFIVNNEDNIEEDMQSQADELIRVFVESSLSQIKLCRDECPEIVKTIWNNISDVYRDQEKH